MEVRREADAIAEADRIVRTTPDPSGRLFVVQNRGGHVQALSPASEVPDIEKNLGRHVSAAVERGQQTKVG